MSNRNLIAAATVTTVALVSSVAPFASGAVKSLFSVNYLTHRFYYLAQPGLIWSNVAADLVTASSYFAIFAFFFWLAHKFRRVPELHGYVWIFVSFGLFILGCGASHVMETVTIWWPVYRLSVFVKMLTAALSVGTAVYLIAQAGTLAKAVRHQFDLMDGEEVQAALRRSKDLLDRVGRLIDVGGWEIDLVTGELTWSNEIARILGFPIDYKPKLEEALALYPVEAREVLSAAIELASAGGPGWDLELPSFRFDGSPYWIRVVGGVEFRDGKPVRLSGASQDITDRVNQRLALQKANERVTLAADSGGIGIWDWDIVNDQLVCDAWTYRLYGLEPEDVLTPLKFWEKNMHPDDREDFAQQINDAVAGRKPYQTNFRVIWPDGTVHRLEGIGQVSHDDAGRAVRMVGTNRDITESRQLVADLAEQHELLRVTLQSISEGVITKGADRNIIWMNAVAERLTGWSIADAVSRPVARMFNAINEVTRLKEDVHLALFPAGDQAVSSSQPTLLVSRDGSECLIESTASPLRNAHGDLLGSVLVFRDVTDQRRSAAETERANKLQLDLKLKDEFLSHVSHELRSPLTSIYSFSSIIADELAGETTSPQKAYLQIILKNVVQLQAMIEDLLTVTQSREGKLNFDLQSVSVMDAIEDTMSTIQGAASNKQITLSAGDYSQLPPACADPIRLRQILIILFDNAVKFTPLGGSVTVSVAEGEPGFLLIQVADTGCGISLQDRARVFEKLYQVTGPNLSDTSNTGRTGLGLGLHIARSLVAAQGGYIWVSGAPGQGSTFNFTLPIYTEARAEFASESHPLRRKTDVPEAKPLSRLPAA